MILRFEEAKKRKIEKKLIARKARDHSELTEYNSNSKKKKKDKG